MKSFPPIEDLTKNTAWTKDSAFRIRFIGTSELAASLQDGSGSSRQIPCEQRQAAEGCSPS
jgi:hypothetical protein